MWSASSSTVISIASRWANPCFIEVFEATRAGDDDVDAALEGRDLALLRDAAEDRGDGEAVGGGQRLHRGA